MWAVSTLTMLVLAGILPDFRLRSAAGSRATDIAVTAALGAGAFGLLSALVWPLLVRLLLLVPAARGSSETFGWLPLWLLVMPLSAWCVVHRFRLRAATATADRRSHTARRHRSGPQARRRARPLPRPALPKAA